MTGMDMVHPGSPITSQSNHTTGNVMLLDDSCWIHELNWARIRDHLTKDDVVLVPVGATEQHGDHTPLLVDTGWAIAVAEGAARQANALVAPPLHFGWSTHHLAYSGAITLRPETLIDVLVDIGESLVYHGFKRIVFVNGNRIANLPPMEIAATKLRFRTGAYASVVDVGLIARREVGENFVPGHNGHAGDSETSFMLHWRPDLVDMTRASKGSPHGAGPFPTNPMPIEPPFDVNAISVRPTDAEFLQASQPTGIGGDATVATAEKGKAVLEAIVKNTVIHIEDIRKKTVNLKPVSIPI
jgi:creatinine amidohydrolase